MDTFTLSPGISKSDRMLTPHIARKVMEHQERRSPEDKQSPAHTRPVITQRMNIAV